MILTVGDSKLVKVETEDDDIGSSAFLHDYETLLKALREHGGMGIAAPQLGISRRLLLIESKPNERYPHAPVMDLIVMANPRIISESSEKELGWEGCLSVPGKRVHILRSTSVSVTYFDLSGNPCELTLNGFPARVFLHEFDHLEGLSILDRAKGQDSILNEEEYFDKIADSQN